MRRSAPVLSREILDEAVLLDPESGLYFGLNATASVLWSAMAEATTLRELASLLVTKFGVSNEQAWADVRRFVGELKRHGLVEILEP